MVTTFNMYFYFQATKSSKKSVYYRLGYNPRNEFEFYYSEDHCNWNKIEVLSIGNLYELKQTNNTDKAIFSYSEEAEEIILKCNIVREPRIAFSNDKYEKAFFDPTFALFYELKLVKIASASLPVALQENKFPSSWDRASGSLTDLITTDEELSFSPRRKDEQVSDLYSENDIHIQYEQSELSDEQSDSTDNCLNITMQTLGLIETALGSGAVYIALVYLKIGTVMSTATAIGGGVIAFAGFTFFVARSCRSCKERDPEPGSNFSIT
jgi:hypothetical protein